MGYRKVGEVKSKDKALQNFEVDQVLKIDATFFQQSGSKKVDITLKPFSDETSLEIACRWQTCMGGQVKTIMIIIMKNTGCSIKQFTSGSKGGAYRFISEQKHPDLGRKKILRYILFLFFTFLCY